MAAKKKEPEVKEPEKADIKDLSIYHKLAYIQQKIKAGKDQANAKGGFNYRSNESVLNILKPFLEETGSLLIQDEEIVQISDRYYVKASSELKDLNDPDSSVYAKAFAREPLHSNEMDENQLTGSTGSYAKKYSLGNLLLLDDAKDPDSLDKKPLPEKTNAGSVKPITVKTELDEPRKEVWDMLVAMCGDGAADELQKLTTFQGRDGLVTGKRDIALIRNKQLEIVTNDVKRSYASWKNTKNVKAIAQRREPDHSTEQRPPENDPSDPGYSDPSLDLPF